MAAIVDKARDFWERISPRERWIVVMAAIAAPLIIAVWLGMSIHDGLSARALANERTRKALRAVEDLQSRGAVPQPGDDVLATMTTEPIHLETYLDKAAQKAGTQLKGDVTPRTSAPRNNFVTNTVSCQLNDITIEQLKTFLQEVETDSKLVMVTKLEMRRDFKAKDKVDATMDVSTYSREKTDRDSAGSGSGSAAGSADPAKKGS